MAGNIFYDEGSIITLQDRTNTVAMATGSAAAAATADLDCRTATAGNGAGMLLAMFELLCRWTTITGISVGVAVAELYLVPLLDGTNLPDVDLTAGTSGVSQNGLMGVFSVAKQAVTATDMRFFLGPVPLFPALQRAYILNRSGQTITTTSGSSWQLRAVLAQGGWT